jgi:hypothetical protein
MKGFGSVPPAPRLHIRCALSKSKKQWQSPRAADRMLAEAVGLVIFHKNRKL